ncbi:hypothetical protein FACS189415_0130 [Bacteroidia bacterium]|nr:hypothetical protein FACS189426_14550 [Bacteroidia bacterium]GHU81573.1 hypothetical protein FACS189415_0130 [Bacteroidia bacterium]GHV70642.1 hypothetical protein FACS189420_2580 [Bacteroidia bacterium]
MSFWNWKQKTLAKEAVHKQSTVSERQSDEIFAAIAMALSEAPLTAGLSSEIHAVIALALSETMEWHDVESNVLTIQNVANNYSPWSSKIYTLRELPLRR